MRNLDLMISLMVQEFAAAFLFQAADIIVLVALIRTTKTLNMVKPGIKILKNNCKNK